MKNIRILLSTVAFTMAIATTAQAGKVCSDPITGDINSRVKCKANEVPVTANNLMDIIKKKSNYLASCRMVDVTDYAESGTAGATLDCASNEFLLNFGNYTDPVTLNVVRWNLLRYDGNIPTGVSIATQIDFGVPGGTTKAYTLHVTGTCCPRI